MIKCISDVCKYIPSLPNGGTHQKVIFVKPKHNTAPSLSRESHREEARVGVGRVFVLQDYNSELLSYGCDFEWYQGRKGRDSVNDLLRL